MTILNGIFIVLISFCYFYHLRIIQGFVFKLSVQTQSWPFRKTSSKNKHDSEIRRQWKDSRKWKYKEKQNIMTQKKKFSSFGNNCSSNLRNTSKETGRMHWWQENERKEQECRANKAQKEKGVNVRPQKSLRVLKCGQHTSLEFEVVTTENVEIPKGRESSIT